MSWSRPDGALKWQVLQSALAYVLSWQTKHVSIFGNCIRVASPTSVIEP